MQEYLRRRVSGGTGYRSKGLAILLAALVLSWLSLLVLRPDAIDRAILDAVYIGDQPALKFLARHVGHIGAPEAVLMLTICVGAYLVLQGQYSRASIPLAATLFAHVTAVLQRGLIGRPRPEGLDGLPELHAPSLPPTRIVDPMTAYLLVALLLSDGARRRPLAIAAAVVIGGSNGVARVVLGHHWASDALAGWTFGAAIAVAFYWISKYLPVNKAQPPFRVRRIRSDAGPTAWIEPDLPPQAEQRPPS